MKMMITFLFLLLSMIVNAEEICTTDPILNQEVDFTQIHCKIESGFRKKPTQKFCETCNIEPDILNKNFRKKIAKEKTDLILMKTITQPLLDSFRIGSNKDLNIDQCYAGALKDSLEDERKGCSKDSAELLKDFSSRTAKEVAKLISKTPDQIEGQSFFNRDTQTKMCNISDAQALLLETQNLDKTITSSDLNDFLNLIRGKKTFKEIDDTISLSGASQTTKKLIRHPIIRNIAISHPEDLEQFLKKNSNPTTKEIRDWLYSKKNINTVSQNTNAQCQKSFQEVAKMICSDDYKDGQVSISDYSSFEKEITDEKYKEYSTTLYCSQFKERSLSIEDVGLKSLENDQLGLQNYDSSNFSNLVYRSNISNAKIELCSSQDNPCTDSKSPQCQLAQEVKTATEKNVSSFDKETIKKLRDILGPDVQADESTRKTLIASGIMTEKDFSQIPHSTNVVANPSPIDPSKEREVMGTSPAKTIVPVNQNIAGANIAPYSGFNGNSSYSNTTQEETREVYKERGPVLPPSTAEYIKQMSSMNRDLLDRLVKEKGAKDKYSNDEIKEQLARMSKERDLPLPLDQQAQFFDHEWSDIAPKVMPLVPDDLKYKEGNGRKTATIGTPLSGKALDQKKYNDQRNRALEQFGKGADNTAPVTDGNAVTMSVNNELLLKKVRLDVPDEKLEKLNLSVILDQKLGTDKEGKKLKGLIDSKQSFLLDIEGKVAFMVEYSETKKGFDIKALKNNLPPEVFEKIKIQISDFLSKNERKHEYSALKEELKN